MTEKFKKLFERKWLNGNLRYAGPHPDRKGLANSVGNRIFIIVQHPSSHCKGGQKWEYTETRVWHNALFCILNGFSVVQSWIGTNPGALKPSFFRV